MAYTSLKDLYLEDVAGIPVPPLPRQQVTLAPNVLPSAPVSQSPEQQATAMSNKENSISPPSEPPFALNQVVELAWPPPVKNVPFSIKQFDAKQGEGNGERRATALFYPKQEGESEKNYTRRLGTYIGGQYDSFDVSTPFGRFEVKEFKLGASGKYGGSVRIGAEGKHTTGNILSQIKDLLVILLHNYAAMDDDSKKILNDSLIETITTKNKVPGNWTLELYIDAIFDVNIGQERGIQEFPKTLFNTSSINPENFHRNPKRKAFLVYTIPQVLAGLKQLAIKDENQTNLDAEIGRVQNLQSALKNLYLKKTDDSFSKELEREAEVLDRRLISKACVADRGTNCITLNTFLQKIDKANLTTTFTNIDQLRNSEVSNLFPEEVIGFFAVFDTKFKYIPRNKFIDYLYIDSFTQKGLKIALRQNPENKSREAV